MVAEKKPPATKRRVIYAESQEAVRHDRKSALIFSLGSAVGIIISVALIAIGFFYYTPLLWLFWILLFLIIIFIRGVWIWTVEYLSRARFTVYEDGITPSYVPPLSTVKRKNYVVPFLAMKGISIIYCKETSNGNKKLTYVIRLPDDRLVEITGIEEDSDIHSFLKSIKDRYSLMDIVARKEPESLRDRLSAGYREQLKRWGIKQKDEK